jgi:hypothetical protein
VVYVYAYRVKDWMVKRVEQLGAELELDVIMNPNILESGQIPKV